MADNFITQNPIILYTIVGIVIVGVIYLLWRKYQQIYKKQQLEPIFIRKPLNAKKPSTRENKLVPLPRDGTGYSLTVWLWIDDWSYRYGEWKHILHKGGEDATKVQPGIWLHPTKNQIYVAFDRDNRPPAYHPFQANKNYGSCLGGQTRHVMENTTLKEVKEWADAHPDCQGYYVVTEDPTNLNSRVLVAQFPQSEDTQGLVTSPEYQIVGAEKLGMQTGVFVKGDTFPSMNPAVNKEMIYNRTETSNVQNVPMGRWFHLGIVVNTQSTDIYVDGEIVESHPLASSAKQNNGQLYITQHGGYSGLITQLRYYDTSLSHGRIAEIYSWGPNPWMLPNLAGDLEKLKANTKFNVSFKVSANVDGKSVNVGESLSGNVGTSGVGVSDSATLEAQDGDKTYGGTASASASVN